jgi:hypothetical protein
MRLLLLGWGRKSFQSRWNPIGMRVLGAMATQRFAGITGECRRGNCASES